MRNAASLGGGGVLSMCGICMIATYLTTCVFLSQVRNIGRMKSVTHGFQFFTHCVESVLNCILHGVKFTKCET